MSINKPITYLATIEYLQSYEVIKKLSNEFLLTGQKYQFEDELLKKIKNNNPTTYDLSMEDSFDFFEFD